MQHLRYWKLVIRKNPMMNNCRYKRILLLFLSVLVIGSCKAQQDSTANHNYEAYTEHQYNIKPDNDTLLLNLFKVLIPQIDQDSGLNGKIYLEIELDIQGNVTDVTFNKLYKLHIAEEVKESLLAKIKEQVKYKVTEDARNYYTTLGKPIKINVIILGRDLVPN